MADGSSGMGDGRGDRHGRPGRDEVVHLLAVEPSAGQVETGEQFRLVALPQRLAVTVRAYRAREDCGLLQVSVVEQHPGVPVTVMGHSGGALAAYLLVTRYPEIASAVVLSAGPLMPIEWIEAELSGEVQETDDLDPTGMLSTHPDYVHALIHDPLVYKGGFRPETIRAVTQVWPEADAALEEGRPDVPVLFVSGEEDPVVPVEVTRTVAARLPHAELRTFPGDLHDVLNEHNRDEVHEVIAAWLARVLGEKRTVAGSVA